jgi:hypothetical protein
LSIEFERVGTADDGLTFVELARGLRARGYNRENRLYAMFVEPNQGYAGVGEASMPETPNEAPQYALVVNWSGQWTLHETGHMLGAVPFDAPHQFQSGHCSEQWDVMCRHPLENTLLRDSGLYRLACPDAPSWYFDCNHDDYYLHDGDWWDVTDSKFLTPGE